MVTTAGSVERFGIALTGLGLGISIESKGKGGVGEEGRKSVEVGKKGRDAREGTRGMGRREEGKKLMGMG